MKKKEPHVIVTGGAGYVGSVLVRRLLKKGYKVRVIDKLLFGSSSIRELRANPNFSFVRADIRDISVMKGLLKGASGVFHMAAYVGEHAYRGQEREAGDVNKNASFKIISLSAQSGIKRFIFTSTCSNYGQTDTAGFAKEETKLNPLSQYAEDKIAVEEFLKANSGKNNFRPVICRCATVYGISPRMRFDLLINELVRDAALRKKIQVYAPESWRPFVHVDDLARALVDIFETPAKKMSNMVFNIGQANYQKRSIIKMLAERMENFAVDYKKGEFDKRNYRVSFMRFKKKFNFKFRKEIGLEISRINDAIKEKRFKDPFRGCYDNYLKKG